jgi:hypothetical protein
MIIVEIVPMVSARFFESVECSHQRRTKSRNALAEINESRIDVVVWELRALRGCKFVLHAFVHLAKAITHACSADNRKLKKHSNSEKHSDICESKAMAIIDTQPCFYCCAQWV